MHLSSQRRPQTFSSFLPPSSPLPPCPPPTILLISRPPSLRSPVLPLAFRHPTSGSPSADILHLRRLSSQSCHLLGCLKVVFCLNAGMYFSFLHRPCILKAHRRVKPTRAQNFQAALNDNCVH